MTEDRARKQAVRRRMEQTGEKYSEARRALLGETSQAQRYPWFYAPYWEEQRERYQRLAREEGEAVARATIYSALHSVQLSFTLTPFFFIARGRPPSGADGWMSERAAVECNAMVIDASGPLAEGGFAREIDRNRRIVNRALSLICEWSTGASDQARRAAEAERATLGILRSPPRRRPGPAPARPWGDRSKELGRPPDKSEHEYFLRAPQDNWFRRPRQGMEDAVLVGLIEAWIEDLEANYRELVEGIPDRWPDQAELDFVAVAEDLDEDAGHGQNEDWDTGLPSPARVRVEHVNKGEVGEIEAVATQMLLVGKSVSPQPDGIAVLPGERWHIRGQRLADQTIMPLPGTYRLASAAPG